MTEDPPTRTESLAGAADGRRFSPSAGRNREAIAAALVDERLPGWTWLPTERDPEALASIRTWVAHAGIANLREPITLEHLQELAERAGLAAPTVRRMPTDNVLLRFPRR
ncbi:MAG TPA: DUF938 domain-containing protein [bacterium]|nr:DUF938 domain-containing protein [bacterium]